MSHHKKPHKHHDEHKKPENEQDEKGSKEESSNVEIRANELEKLKQDLQEYKDKYLRLLADVENTRKRMQKERQEMTNFAVENAIVDFLSPIDNLENALKFASGMPDEVKNWAVGFEMILRQLKDALANNGVIVFNSLGIQFDPHYHEAIEMVETEKESPGTIVEECVRGYKMGEHRIVRPARVKVAKAPQTVKEIQEEKITNQEEENK